MKKEMKGTFIQKKLKFSYLFLIVGIVTIALSSCKKESSSDVNQDKIWTEYVVYYDQNDDKTHAIARFKFGNSGGTLLELVDSTGAKVTFNGTKMPYSVAWSGHHLEFAGNVTTGTFVYTNSDSISYTNAVPSGVDTIAFKSNFDTIVKSQSETFTWVGSSLSANQSVGVYVGTWAWDNDALFFTNASGATNLVMGVQAKSGLTLGTATAYMARSVQSNSINGTSKGGLIRYSYRPLDKNVVVVP